MPVFKPNSIILYVKDIALSTRFYKEILGAPPLETFQNFSVFALRDNFTLGLKSQNTVDPKPEATSGGVELCLSDTTADQTNKLYADWKNKQIPIALEPTKSAFGYTFVALDPDGHRLRVCATDTSNIN